MRLGDDREVEPQRRVAEQDECVQQVEVFAGAGERQLSRLRGLTYRVDMVSKDGAKESIVESMMAGADT